MGRNAVQVIDAGKCLKPGSATGEMSFATWDKRSVKKRCGLVVLPDAASTHIHLQRGSATDQAKELPGTDTFPLVLLPRDTGSSSQGDLPGWDSRKGNPGVDADARLLTCPPQEGPAGSAFDRKDSESQNLTLDGSPQCGRWSSGKARRNPLHIKEHGKTCGLRSVYDDVGFGIRKSFRPVTPLRNSFAKKDLIHGLILFSGATPPTA